MRRRRPNWIAGITATGWLFIVLLPVYVLVLAAVQTQPNYSSQGPLSLPKALTGSNFSAVIHAGFLHYFLNTLIVSVAVVAIVALVVPPLSFAIVRGRGKLSSGAFRLFLLGLAVPAQAVIVPMFYLMIKVGLYDSFAAIILPTAAFVLPVTTLIMSGNMRDITSELYEAMAMDGASSWRTFRQLVMPLSRGGLATIVVFAALNAWNGFLFPLVLTQSSSVRVFTLGLFNFETSYGINVPEISAAVIISIVPILLVYLFARRALVQGLMGVGGR
jgi:xylobiose transport system permease protein